MIRLEFIPPYYQQYLKYVQDKNILELLSEDLISSEEYFESIPESKFDHAYATGKWTVKQVLQHLIDTERIFAYRALRFTRNDPEELSGFEQDNYIAEKNLSGILFENLLKEWILVRKSTIIFFENLAVGEQDRTGRVDGQEFTPEGIGYIIVGHTRHHISILKEKYQIG